MTVKICSKCNEEKELIANFSKLSKNSKYYRGQCKTCRVKIQMEYRNINHNKIKTYQESYKSRRNMLRNERRKTDTGYRIKRNLRDRIRKALATNTKTSPTLTLLGCSIKEFKQHLQKTAITNGYKSFDIENYSSDDYHIDHIKPCAAFDLTKESEQQQCFHHSNMQILTAQANMLKSDTFI